MSELHLYNQISNTTEKLRHETPRDCKHIIWICWTPFCTLSQEVLISPHTNASHSWMHPAHRDTEGGLQAPPFLCGRFPYLHLPHKPPHLPALLHVIHWAACCWGTSVLHLCCHFPRCRAGRGSLWQVGCSASGAASGIIKRCVAAAGLYSGRDFRPFKNTSFQTHFYSLVSLATA